MPSPQQSKHGFTNWERSATRSTPSWQNCLALPHHCQTARPTQNAPSPEEAEKRRGPAPPTQPPMGTRSARSTPMENQQTLELFVRLPDGEFTVAEINERATEILTMFLVDTDEEVIKRMLRYFHSEQRRRRQYEASLKNTNDRD